MGWPRAILALVLSVVTLVNVATAADLRTVKRWGRNYVPLESFCAAYGFDKPGRIIANKPFQVKGSLGVLEFTLNDRDARVNGARTWLSFPLVEDAEAGLLISETDVSLLLEPVLRPQAVLSLRAVRGVVIDPGHGGADRGARSPSGYTEKVATLVTARHLKGLLEADGVPVVMTRNSDVFMTLQDRARLANRYPNHIFVSIHYNSASVASANGVETFSTTPRGAGSTSAAGKTRKSDFDRYPGNRYDLHNVVLADFVHREMIKMHTKKGDRGLKRARFVVLREVGIPAVLVEGGFLSHWEDARLIEGESYKKKVAAAVHRAIMRYIVLMKSDRKEDSAAPQPAVAASVDKAEVKDNAKPAGEPVPPSPVTTTPVTPPTPTMELRPPDTAVPLDPALTPADVLSQEEEIIQRLRRVLESVGEPEGSARNEPAEENSEPDSPDEEIKPEAPSSEKDEKQPEASHG